MIFGCWLKPDGCDPQIFTFNTSQKTTIFQRQMPEDTAHDNQQYWAELTLLSQREPTIDHLTLDDMASKELSLTMRHESDGTQREARLAELSRSIGICICLKLLLYRPERRVPYFSDNA